VGLGGREGWKGEAPSDDHGRNQASPHALTVRQARGWRKAKTGGCGTISFRRRDTPATGGWHKGGFARRIIHDAPGPVPHF
jgi:hypothetical protein